MVKEKPKLFFIVIQSQNKHTLSSYCMLRIEKHDLTLIETDILEVFIIILSMFKNINKVSKP